jgi:hypothetical protein
MGAPQALAQGHPLKLAIVPAGAADTTPPGSPWVEVGSTWQGGQGVGQIVSSNLGPFPPFTGININNFLGANRFYNAGYTGTQAIVANIEAGHVRGTAAGHETLMHVTTFLHATPPLGSQLGEFDFHATWVGQAIGGRLGGLVPGEYQRGVAHGAELWSGAIATNWVSPLGFVFNNASFTTPYATALLTGVGGRTADVVNSSWNFSPPNLDAAGVDPATLILDALANGTGKTLVFSAGNFGPNPNTVAAPASGYNSITVAALGTDTGVPPYATVSNFSSRGPSTYVDGATGIPLGSLRATVDIATPGDNLTLALYGGTTGGNTGGVDPTGGANNFYGGNLAGTSFAAPIVAGGAALLVDAGKTIPGTDGVARSIDGRVIKAVLLNSADKTPGWNNNQFVSFGAVITGQSLDLDVGAGRMNLDRAFDQYFAGTRDVPGLGGGVVEHVGWDFGAASQLNAGGYTDYFIDPVLRGGSTFTATLSWFVDRLALLGLDANLDLVTLAVADASFDDLDLELWLAQGGMPSALVAASLSFFNNVEHFSFQLPQDGQYVLRVRWFGENYDLFDDANAELYGLAWAGVPVPAPPSFWLAAAGLASLGVYRRVRKAAV